MQARPGDSRPLTRQPGTALALRPNRPLRLLPRHGHPYCAVEWVTQRTVKALANPRVYFALSAAFAAGLEFGLR